MKRAKIFGRRFPSSETIDRSDLICVNVNGKPYELRTGDSPDGVNPAHHLHLPSGRHWVSQEPRCRAIMVHAGHVLS
jgi:hypothetical protein